MFEDSEKILSRPHGGLAIPRAQFHFIQRLAERYQLMLSPDDCAELIRKIDNGEFPHVKMRDSDRKLFQVSIQKESEPIFILVSHDGSLITTMPPDKKSIRRFSMEKFGRTKFNRSEAQVGDYVRVWITSNWVYVYSIDQLEVRMSKNGNYVDSLGVGGLEFTFEQLHSIEVLKKAVVNS